MNIQRSVGYPVAAEGMAFLSDRLYKTDASRKAIVLSHPHGWTFTTPETWSEIQNLAGAGYPVVAGDQGGPATWANDSARSKLGTLGTWAQAAPGNGVLGAGGKTGAGNLLGLGVSMGGPSLLMDAITNPTRYGALAFVIPVVDLADMYDTNNGGISTAEMNTAYTVGGGWPAQAATHNPNTTANKAALAALGIPIKIWYGDNDFTANNPTIQAAFAAAIGAETKVLAGADHQLGYLPAYDLVRYFDAHGGRS